MQSLTTLASSLNARVGAQRCSAISVQILTRRNSLACSIHSGVPFNTSTQHSYPLRDANSLYKGLNLALTFGSSIEYPILLREGDVRDKSNPAFSTDRSRGRNKLAASDTNNGPCPWRERDSSAQPRGNLRRTIRERKIHSDSNSDSCE